MALGHRKAKAKATYSFVIATKMLDEEAVRAVHSWAIQTKRKNHAEFDRLCHQVEKDKIPHLLGTGWAKSEDAFDAGFVKWLTSQGLDILHMRNIEIERGGAEDPQSGPFDWAVFVCFELDK